MAMKQKDCGFEVRIGELGKKIVENGAFVTSFSDGIQMRWSDWPRGKAVPI